MLLAFCLDLMFKLSIAVLFVPGPVRSLRSWGQSHYEAEGCARGDKGGKHTRPSAVQSVYLADGCEFVVDLPDVNSGRCSSHCLGVCFLGENHPLRPFRTTLSIEGFSAVWGVWEQRHILLWCSEAVTCLMGSDSRLGPSI
ncbi:uncharacterized protein LOC124619587 [Schistocerca americana]|uniref:uncharacterized protein LOC124619587 n=1 Tax=Schistocerca americana TaxID=7009 RepID=UPI001F4F9023|nr:uncharacterized protein LOC124619587 [Schistocerca americana]